MVTTQIPISREATKADIMELYAKTITNLGPVNPLFRKDISYYVKDPERGYLGGFFIVMYRKVSDAYIAVQMMSCPNSNPKLVELKRESFYSKREIKIENLENRCLITISDSERGIRKITHVLNQIFIDQDPKIQVLGKMLANYLTTD